jgi:hypothetical protein
MNLIIIPFHDWRKSEYEGFRTRDVHFIKAFEKIDEVKKILVVNRPFTKLELILKKNKLKLNGEIIFVRDGFTITQISDKIYVLDYKSNDIIGQLRLRHKWFIKKYGNKKLLKFITEAQEILSLTNPSVICQNVFAYRLLVKFKADNKVFDAWDNFIKFPTYAHLKSEIEIGYHQISENVKFWITNSTENQVFFKNKFFAKEVSLIKNGVNEDFAKDCLEMPSDMKNIPRPIAGFGGKLSYLIDVELINHIVKDNPKLSFVFVGQVLDKKKFGKIISTPNVYFLGDKKYNFYPCYVNQFDIGIIPYEINEKQHGGDSIKAYEYLQAGKKVIGTKGNGLVDLSNYLHLAEDKYQFSMLLKSALVPKKSFNAKDFSWESKANKMLRIIEK